MQIVIEIDDDLYTRLFDNGVDNYDDAEDMAKAIRKGTSLPKGHGRLNDVDAISLDDINFFSIGDYRKMVAKLNAPAIIEADKESEE